MRVLLIRSDMKLAGPAKLMHAYAAALRERGHEIVVVSGGGAYVPTLVADGFRHHEIPDLQVQARRPLSMLATVAAIRRLLRRHRIEVVNSFNAHAGWMAAFADPFNRCRHFNTVLGTGKERANRLLPGRIFAVSESVRGRLIEAGVASAKISVVHNATLEPRFFAPPAPASAPADQADRPVRLISVAMFTGQKGHELVLPLVAALCHDRGRNVELTLVGDGVTRRQCEQQARDLGIADRVTFTGALPDVVPHLDGADIFVHLPEFETFGIVLAEAMARGLPVLSVKVGGIPEVVEDGRTGLLVDRSDPAGQLDAADRLVGDKALRLSFGTRGRDRARALFSLERLGETLDRLYRI